MIVFVDTSAFLAVFDADDAHHGTAREVWEELLTDASTTLLTTSYVLIETYALLQRRLGMAAVRAFSQDAMPVLSVQWIDEARHRMGVEALLAANRRRLSLVDCVSFECVRSAGADRVFAFDRHFAQQGFALLPK